MGFTLQGKLLEPTFAADFSAVIAVKILPNDKRDALQCADELRDCEIDITVCRHRNRRSLDANAYAWVLMGKIADLLKTSKDEVYRLMLRRYGQGSVAKIRNEDARLFTRAYAYHEKHETLPDEEQAQYYRFWVGSSQYDTREMGVFIDGIISEAKELGLQTETPQEIAKMKSLWREDD